MGSASNFFDSASVITVSVGNIPQYVTKPDASTFSGGTVVLDVTAQKFYQVSNSAWVEYTVS